MSYWHIYHTPLRYYYLHILYIFFFYILISFSYKCIMLQLELHYIIVYNCGIYCIQLFNTIKNTIPLKKRKEKKVLKQNLLSFFFLFSFGIVWSKCKKHFDVIDLKKKRKKNTQDKDSLHISDRGNFCNWLELSIFEFVLVEYECRNKLRAHCCFSCLISS